MAPSTPFPADALPEASARAASAALDAFGPSAGRAYARSRNFDFGPASRHNVSCLSPWLRHRLIEETTVVAASLSRHSLADAEKFVQEVFWRTYFKGWLEQRPAVWTRYCDDVADLHAQLQHQRPLRERYIQALAARTGIDCFDAWVTELQSRGYLHNHARMWFASIWIFTLQLPWQLGADFFYRELLDADPASNTLSWRWVAGLHTRGKHYLARADNIARYTDGRFDPRGLLSTDASPLEEAAPPPAAAPVPPAAPAPRGGRYGLLISAEDCRVESLGLSHPPTAVARLGVRGRATPSGCAGHVLPAGGAADRPAVSSATEAALAGERSACFANAATRDGAKRACAHFDLAHDATAHFTPGEEAWQEQVAAWARTHRLDAVVTAWAPVGPVADQLDACATALRAGGVDLLRVRREYDSLAWPHARRGFFGLKKQIPEILRALGIL
jgi:deoxyribodipyrimidine photo-lyase